MLSQAYLNPNKSMKRQLKTNPFTTYRDPKTGQWFVIKPVA
ncbi:MAG: hypothetical protein SFY66_08335 [Oculatellaceae cyanobacterium bins.114]|nr:hypothetical protein [Oculatellaceae cyanobacterium bins.114]